MRLTNKKVIIYLLLLAVILLLIIPFFRMLQGTLIGEESYYHARIASHILKKGIPHTDTLVNKPYFLQPYHLVLAGLGRIFGIYLASFIIPFLCGLGSVIFFYKILRYFNFRPMKIFLIGIIWILSPIFIASFAASNQHCVALFLLTAGFYFFLKNKNKNFLIALILFALAALFSIFSLIFILAVLFVYSAASKKHRKKVYIIAGLMLLLLFVFYLPFVLYFGFPHAESISIKTVLLKYISDLGGLIGYGIFNILLCLLGLYFIWKKKKQVLAYSIFILLVIFSFYFNAMNIYLNIIFALLAGHGLYGLLRMKWTLKSIKKLTMACLIAGLMFSATSYIGRTAATPPNQEIISSLEWLEDNSNEHEIVFSHHSKGFWIEAIAKRPVVTDSSFKYTNEFKTIINDSEKVFYSRNLIKTRELLNQYNITYIWIDKQMQQGQVWSAEQEGLLFLFRNTETFKKIYDQNGIIIYKCLGG